MVLRHHVWRLTVPILDAMPIYEFKCNACDHVFERLQKLSDADPTICPECGAEQVRRQLTAPAFRLAGSGWYETDFKKDSDKKSNLATKDEAPKSESSSSDSAKADLGKSESKPTETAKSDAVKPASNKADPGAGTTRSTPATKPQD